MRFGVIGASSLLTALSVLFAAESGSAQTIGYAERIDLYAYGTRPGDVRRPLFVRNELVSNQIVETVERGGAALRLADDTSFVIGPASTVTLDRYVYDPQTSAGEAAIRLGVGTFRYVSGRMAKERISIRVPAATIGVRGTTIGIQVQENQGSVVQVTEGAAIVTPDGGQPPVNVSAGQTAVIAPDGAVTVVTTSGAVPPIGPNQSVETSTPDADGSSSGDSSSSSSSGSSGSSGSGGSGGSGGSSGGSGGTGGTTI
jgi:hypothetical protein